MRRATTALIATCLILTILSGIAPTTAEDPPPQEGMGSYRQLWADHELNENHVTELPDGFKIEGPAFTNELNVNTAFLEGELGAWGADRAFEPGNGTAQFAGRKALFKPLSLGEEAVFTWGHESQLKFFDRPMWVTAEQSAYGEPITLNIEDGDTTGQAIFVAKSWLWERGIPRPVAIHEDGTELVVNATEDGAGFIIHVHHFSIVQINPVDLDVKGRQNGLVFPHTGQRRWYPEELRLEVDVGQKLTSYEVLVDKAWVDFHIPSPALRDRTWTEQFHQGAWYYTVWLSASQTPTTLTFEDFVAPAANVFTRGSLDLFRLTLPMLISVDIEPEKIDIVLPAQPFGIYVTMNATWVMDLGITSPLINSTSGRILSWGVIDGTWFQFPVTAGTGGIQITQAGVDSGTPKLVNGLVATALGDKCSEALDGAFLELDSWQEGSSQALLYVGATAWCFEWQLHDNRAEFYNVEINLTDETNGIECGSGEETDHDLTSKEGYRVCQWELVEDVPTGYVVYSIVATAYWVVDAGTTWTMVLTGVTCAVGATAVIVAAFKTGGAIVAVPAFQLFAGLVAGVCATFVLQVGAAILDQHGKTTGEVLLFGEGSVEFEDLLGTNQVELRDSHTNEPRLDTWNEIEELWNVRPSGYDGVHRILWTLKDIKDGKITYNSDLSIPKNIRHRDTYIDLSWYPGGADGRAHVRTFPDTFLGTENTEVLYTRNNGNTIPMLDWEAPEPHCVLLEAIVGKVNGLVGEIVVSAYPFGCHETNMFSGPDFLSFSLISHTLDAHAINATSGSISWQDVIAEDGNITRAIARKLVSDEAFIDGIEYVRVPAYLPIGGEGCKVYHQPYTASFSVLVEGKTIAGALDATDSDTAVSVICFDPLGGILTVAVEITPE